MPLDSAGSEHLGVESAIAQAEQAVDEYLCVIAANRKAERDVQLKALGAIYALRGELQDDQKLQALLRLKNVRPHRNTQNRDLLILQAFFGRADQDVRQQQSKWAALLSYAGNREVKPNAEAFAEFVKGEGGILAAYAKWCAIKKAPQNNLVQARAVAERVSVVLKQTADKWYPACPATHEAVHIREGLHLAVLEISPKGSFRVVKVLHRSRPQVAATLGNA
jgi:hypothetical protein